MTRSAVQQAADLEPEVALIGSMILDPSAAAIAMEEVQARDFSVLANRELFTVVVGLIAEGSAIDPIILHNRCVEAGVLERIGGLAYLTQVLQAVPSAANADYYAKIVAERARKARTLDQLRAAEFRLAHDEIGPAEAISGLLEGAASNERGDVLASGESLMTSMLEVISGVAPPPAPRVPTGIAAFDAENVGLPHDGLVIVAGRPSSGKTSLAMQLARNAAVTTGKGALIFSMEMSRHSLMQIIAGGVAGVDTNHIRRNQLDEDEKFRLGTVASQIAGMNLLINDHSAMSPARMMAIAKMRRMRGEIGAIVVDYLQLADGKDGVSKNGTRQEEVAYISRSLKAMSRDMGCPVIALSQLSRPKKGDETKRPQLSDLRESGQIEQDADVVMFVHRPEQHVTDPTEKAVLHGCAEIIVAKFREGVTSLIECRFEHAFQRFVQDSYGSETGDISGFDS